MKPINRINDFKEALKSIVFSGMSSKRKSLVLYGVIMRLKDEGGYSLESIDKILMEHKIKGKWTMTKFLRLATESNEEIDSYAFEKEIVSIVSNQNKAGIGSNPSVKNVIVVSAKEETVAVKQHEASKEDDNMNPGLKFYMSRPQRPILGLKSDTASSSQAVSVEQIENTGKSEGSELYDKIHPKRFSLSKR